MKRLQAWLVLTWLCAGVCTAQTPRLVKDINVRLTPTPSDPRPGAQATRYDDAQFVTVLGVTYFVAAHPATGTELYRSDGTGANTRLALDIWPGEGSSDPRDLATDGWRLFFSADDGRHGRELWMAEPLHDRVRMVKDINPDVGAGSDPTGFTHYNGTILFQAANIGENAELWRTDGTEQNTVLVADLAPGMVVGSRPQHFVVYQQTFYFQAFDGVAARLWRSDGTRAGTVQLPVVVDFGCGDMVEYRGDLYFAGSTPATGSELWRIDGRSRRPVAVHDVYPGAYGSRPRSMTVFRDQLYFVADGAWPAQGGVGVELFKTDGTRLALFDVYRGAAGSQPRSLVVHGGGPREVLFFVARGTLPGTNQATGEDLWLLDEHGLQALDLAPGDAGSNPRCLVTGPGGYLYFAAWSTADSHELWRSDGSATGTRLFKRINRYGSVLGSDPSFLTPHPIAGLLFACDDGPHGKELWKCDGTVAGTALVADINPTQNSTMGSKAILRASVGGGIYFTADAGDTGQIVWTTDGTAAATFPVAGLQQAGVRDVQEVLAVGQQVFVVGSGKDPQGRDIGLELFVVDQRSGAVTTIDLQRGRGGSLPSHLFEFRGRVYFTADGDLQLAGPAIGRELWSSDGTVAGTRLVADLNPGSSGSRPLSSDPDQFFRFGPLLYFAARTELHGLELWRTDGSAAGTRLVADLNPGPLDSHPHGFVELGGRLVFVATRASLGTELVVSDGSAAGTTWIDLRAGRESGFAEWHLRPDRALAVVGDQVYFAADGDLNRSGPLVGMELWRSDGTAAGTHLVADLWAGATGSRPSALVAAGDTDRLVFIATTGSGPQSFGPAVFAADGTANGTVRLRGISSGWAGRANTDSGRFGARNSYFHLPMYRTQGQLQGFEVYVTDGTVAGTRMIVRDFFRPLVASPDPGVLVSESGRLFVTRVDASTGAEVYVTDDHAAATPVGRGCSLAGRPPRLTCGDPLLGLPVRPELRGRANTPGMLMVGMWRAQPFGLGGECRLHVDLFGPLVFLPIATGATGSWRGALRTTGGYVGFHYAIQACLADFVHTGTTEFSNGVVLRAGTR